MKCREMNPGNDVRVVLDAVIADPSMKCREMNPGNGVPLRGFTPWNTIPQ